MRSERRAPADYYEWREFEARLAGRTIRFMAKPGLPDWERADPAAVLLSESIEIGHGERLLELNAGAGIVAVAAALRGARVTTLTDSAIAAEATRRTLAINGVSACDRLPWYDVAVVTLPKSRQSARRAIVDACRALRPGGRIYLGGPNRGGVKRAIEDLREMFGSAEVVAYGKGHRVAAAVRPERLVLHADDGFSETELDVRDARWRVVSAPGVFARDRLDDGTRRLVGTMTVRAGESLLDLGCGCGIVGLVAARLGARVTLVDVSAAAVEATRRTLALNAVVDADVLWCDCASAVMDRRFDVVATNPPFHQGVGTDDAVARQFVHDSARVLRPGGRLYLVANRFLRYERDMSGLFSHVRVAWEDGRFRVLEAVK